MEWKQWINGKWNVFKKQEKKEFEKDALLKNRILDKKPSITE